MLSNSANMNAFYFFNYFLFFHFKYTFNAYTNILSKIENRAYRFRISILYLFSRYITSSHAFTYVSYMKKKKKLSFSICISVWAQPWHPNSPDSCRCTIFHHSMLYPVFYVHASTVLSTHVRFKYFYACTPRLCSPLPIFTYQNIHSSIARFV